MASDQVTVAALGRPFKLGMLYDARRDQLITGSALWDSDTIQGMSLRRSQPFSNFSITASDSAEEKASLLELRASLRASVLFGLAKGQGSATMLHDQLHFQNQCSVTLKYKATTHFEQLSLTEDVCENIQNRAMLEKALATHVVTGIQYGANAFFVFDTHNLEAHEVEETRIKVKAVLRLIFCSEHFDYSHDLTKEQKSLVQKLSVKFYSDFLLASEPTTITGAVQTYTDMTKLLGKNGENAVPVQVWLMPLTFLSQNAARRVREVSVGLVIDAENTLEELSSAQRRCNDCLSVSAVGKFPELNAQLYKFYKLCHYYIVELQRQMAEKCPAIREGKIKESVLKSILDERKNSPFSQDKLTQWLEDKEREVNVVDSTLEILSGVRVLSTQAEVDRFVLAPGDGVLLAYVFTSLETTDAQLVNMGLYLDSLKWEKPYVEFSLTAGAPVPQGQWYNTKDVVVAMRKMAADGMKATPRFHFVTAINNPKYTGAATYQYQGGILQ